MDPDWEKSDLGPHCLQTLLLKSQADDKTKTVVIGSLGAKMSLLTFLFVSVSKKKKKKKEKQKKKKACTKKKKKVLCSICDPILV